MSAVFVSSTFADLKEFRASVCDAIRRLGLVDIAMEHFGSRDERPLDECKRIINKECDVFVGIYAKRYGFIPEGKETSITVEEYETALRAKIPVLAYLLSNEARWPQDMVEQGERAERLDRFKTELSKRHIVSFFAGKDELAAMVAADLGRHLNMNRSRLETVKKLSSESTERELRLLNELRSENSKERDRAASALKQLGSASSRATLVQLLLGPDAGLAYDAAKALECTDQIRHGLLSPHGDVRSWAAFRIGENALQDHDWGLGLVPQMIELLEGRMDSIGVLQQVTHSLGKIGGEKAMKMLLQLLREAGVPTEIKATALHAPFRFWQDRMFSSCVSADLLPEFRDEVSKIVGTWPRALRMEVKHHELFEYLPVSIRAQISKGILEGTLPAPGLGRRKDSFVNE